jgi:hypothetical protein
MQPLPLPPPPPPPAYKSIMSPVLYDLIGTDETTGGGFRPVPAAFYPSSYSTCLSYPAHSSAYLSQTHQPLLTSLFTYYCLLSFCLFHLLISFSCSHHLLLICLQITSLLLTSPAQFPSELFTFFCLFHLLIFLMHALVLICLQLTSLLFTSPAHFPSELFTFPLPIPPAYLSYAHTSCLSASSSPAYCSLPLLTFLLSFLLSFCPFHLLIFHLLAPPAHLPQHTSLLLTFPILTSSCLICSLIWSFCSLIPPARLSPAHTFAYLYPTHQPTTHFPYSLSFCSLSSCLLFFCLFRLPVYFLLTPLVTCLILTSILLTSLLTFLQFELSFCLFLLLALPLLKPLLNCLQLTSLLLTSPAHFPTVLYPPSCCPIASIH